MADIERIRDALVSGINLAKSAGWTRHQKDEVAEAEEALRLFDEMTIQASVKSQLLSQDVGEFIAGNSQTDHIRDEYGDTHYKIDVVDVEDLRAWMSGHVRVPVEPTDAMIEAGRKQHECHQHDPWYSNDELTECDCKAIYKAMLNASKGE